MLANGSAIVAAAISPSARSWAMLGNGMAPPVAAKSLSLAGGELDVLGVDAVLLEHRDVEQVVDVVRRVHPDQLALELGEGGDVRARHGEDRLRALLHERALGDDLDRGRRVLLRCLLDVGDVVAAGCRSLPASCCSHRGLGAGPAGE